MADDDIPDTPLAEETDAMAEVTREHAAKEDADQRTPEGSHGFPSGATDDGYEHQSQQGAGQSDDIHGKAPASGMGRQHAHPSRG